MRTAICIFQDGAWTPVVELSATQDGAVNVTPATPKPKFEAGDSVKIDGRLYQGYGDVERLDGDDVLVRADNDKLYRYNPEDIAKGVIKPVDD
jgi:hypothetical protein